jgi:hypothetical protein
MKKTLPGILLLAVAAFAGWTWWKRRQSAAPAGELAIAPNGDTSLLPQLSQVGSNVYQDVTGDLLTKLIASYERVAGGCWLWSSTAPNGNRYYTNSVSGKGQWFDAGILPTPLCGGSGAVGQNSAFGQTEATTSGTSALRLTRGAAAQGYTVVTCFTGCKGIRDANGDDIGDNC